MIDDLIDLLNTDEDTTSGALRIAWGLRADLEYAREALLQHRPADALAMVERILYPQPPAHAKEAYDKALLARPLNV